MSERALRYKLTKYGFREEASDSDPQAPSSEKSTESED